MPASQSYQPKDVSASERFKPPSHLTSQQPALARVRVVKANTRITNSSTAYDAICWPIRARTLPLLVMFGPTGGRGTGAQNMLRQTPASPQPGVMWLHAAARARRYLRRPASDRHQPAPCMYWLPVAQYCSARSIDVLAGHRFLAAPAIPTARARRGRLRKWRTSVRGATVSKNQ